MSGLTKILIVLQLVFSLALSVLVVLMVSKQESYKNELVANQAGSLALSATVTQDAQQITSYQQIANTAQGNVLAAQNAAAAAQRTAAENISRLTAEGQTKDLAIAKLEAENRANQITIATQVAQNTSLAKQLDEMGPKTISLITENAKVNLTNAELSTALRGAEQSIKRLQEQIAQLANSAPATGASGTPDSSRTLMANGMQTPVQINGEITDIAQSAGRTYVETKLGTRDGVKAQTRLAIYRGNTYVGDAVVTTATTDASVAVVMMVKPGESVQKGDLVMSGQ